MVFVILAVIFAPLCYLVARRKNRNVYYAIIWGILMSWIALLAYLCLEYLAICPNCGTAIKTNSRICWKCGKVIK